MKQDQLAATKRVVSMKNQKVSVKPTAQKKQVLEKLKSLKWNPKLRAEGKVLISGIAKVSISQSYLCSSYRRIISEFRVLYPMLPNCFNFYIKNL